MLYTGCFTKEAILLIVKIDSKKKTREKSHTSLHYCQLFAIQIYFSHFFLDFSRELNSMDNNLNLNFTNGNFCNISRELHFAKMFKIRKIPKMDPREN